MSAIPGLEFVDNTNQRTPCVLLLDISSSMSGEPIRQLNEGLRAFAEELKSDPVASLRVQVMVITVGGPEDVRIVQRSEERRVGKEGRSGWSSYDGERSAE